MNATNPNIIGTRNYCPVVNPKTRLLIALLVFLMTVGAYRPRASTPEAFPNGYETLSVARSLAATGQFANPFRGITGPTAHVAPSYPALIAFCIRVTGSEGSAYRVLRWLNVIFLSLSLAMLPGLAAKFGFGLRSGIFAAALWLIAHVPLIVEQEATLAMLLIVAVTSFGHDWWQRGGPLRSFSLGLLWGLLLLVSPSPLIVLVAFLAITVRKKLVPLRSCAIFAAGTLLVVLPWSLRNVEQLHHFVFVRDNLGIELHVSNNDCSQFSLSRNIDSRCHFLNHPIDSDSQSALLRQMGEVEYNRSKEREAIAWITHNPSRFAKLTAQRALAFWIPFDAFDLDESPSSIVMTYLITVFAFVGLFMFIKKEPLSATLLYIWLIFFPLIYYVIQYSARYSQPLLWILFLLAAYVVDDLISLVSSRRLTSASS